jgi:hypothetical protein
VSRGKDEKDELYHCRETKTVSTLRRTLHPVKHSANESIEQGSHVSKWYDEAPLKFRSQLANCSVQNDNMDPDDCPICWQRLPAADKNFKPCPCGFRFCVWCWQTLVSADYRDTLQKPRCPSCREPLAANPHWGGAQAASRAARSRVDVKKVEAGKKVLIELVVDDRRLVIVEGLPRGFFNSPAAALNHEFFGQYGRIVNFLLSDQVAAVRYQHSAEAEAAVACIDGVRVCARRSRSSISSREIAGEIGELTETQREGASSSSPSAQPASSSTLTARVVHSRWCPAYLRGTPCTRRHCIDLHEPWRKHEMPAVPDSQASDLTYFRSQAQAHPRSINPLQRAEGVEKQSCTPGDAARIFPAPRSLRPSLNPGLVVPWKEAVDYHPPVPDAPQQSASVGQHNATRGLRGRGHAGAGPARHGPAATSAVTHEASGRGGHTGRGFGALGAAAQYGAGYGRSTGRRVGGAPRQSVAQTAP